jgi:hypothetical protein
LVPQSPLHSVPNTPDTSPASEHQPLPQADTTDVHDIFLPMIFS